MLSPDLVGEPMEDEQLCDSVNFILSLQVRKEEESFFNIYIHMYVFAALHISNIDPFISKISESKWRSFRLGASRSSEMVGGKH